MAMIRFGEFAIDWLTVYVVQLTGFKEPTPEHGSLSIYADVNGVKSNEPPQFIEVTDANLAGIIWRYSHGKAGGLTVAGGWAVDLNRLSFLKIDRYDSPFTKPMPPTARIVFSLREQAVKFPIPVDVAEMLLQRIHTPTQTD